MAESEKPESKHNNSTRQGHSEGGATPEWITFAIGLVIILGIVGLQIYLHVVGGAGPPRIVVRPVLTDLYQIGSDYYLPVEVINEGGETAEDVQVQLTLQSIDGKAETITFSIVALSTNEVSQNVAVFKTDSSQCELTYLVTFKNP